MGEMTDLEMTRLCAEAIGYTVHPVVYKAPQVVVMGAPDRAGGFIYDPLHNKSQAFALVERFRPDITVDDDEDWLVWGKNNEGNGASADLCRAIVTCVALMQQAKAADGGG